MEQVIEMGFKGVPPKIPITPSSIPVNADSTSKGSNVWMWVILLILIIIIGYVIYQRNKSTIPFISSTNYSYQNPDFKTDNSHDADEKS